MLFDQQTLVLASSNAGKLRELSHQLAPLDIEVKSQADYQIEPVEETGLTFVENALLKAREACRVSGLPALGDDSGLVVQALNGGPGIRSARFAGDEADDAQNNEKLLRALDGMPMAQRQAHFHCCLVLLRHADDPDPVLSQGRWYGQILTERQGTGGFGYDPLFFDPQQGSAAAELSLAKKALISHRGIALRALIEQIKSRR